MVALTVVILIQIVGLILVIALITLPAAIAGQYVWSLGKMMLVAVVLGVLFTIPLRRSLIVEGDLKFPEGIATAEVLAR